MSATNRREFLRASGAVALSAAVPPDLFAQALTTALPASAAWDSGSVRHLLPTVSDSRMLIKVSFRAPLTEAPTLRVGDTSVRGRMGDTRGEFWQFPCGRSRAGPPATASRSPARAAGRCASRGSLRPFRRPMRGRRNCASCSRRAPAATRR